jgi:hypothetical protein
VIFERFPPDLEPVVRAAVARWYNILPGWVERVVFTYDDTNAEDYASCTPRYEQREAHVYVHPLFWSLDAAGRDNTIIHEFSHIIMAPCDDVYASLVATVTDGNLAAWATEAYERAGEAVVSDLAAAFMAG